MALASASRTLSTLSLILIIRQVFYSAVRSCWHVHCQFVAPRFAASAGLTLFQPVACRLEIPYHYCRFTRCPVVTGPFGRAEHSGAKVDSTLHPRRNGRCLERL